MKTAFCPYDLLLTTTPNGKNLHTVDSVCLGIVGQQDLIGLTSLIEHAGWADGQRHTTVYVPGEILDAAIKGGAIHLRQVGKED